MIYLCINLLNNIHSASINEQVRKHTKLIKNTCTHDITTI